MDRTGRGEAINRKHECERTLQLADVHSVWDVPACLCLDLFGGRDKSVGTLQRLCFDCKSIRNARAFWEQCVAMLGLCMAMYLRPSAVLPWQ